MKSMLKACVSMLTAVAVSSALSGAAVAQEALKEIGKGEGQVDIVAWPGYIERGETDKNFDWVTSFEKETGCKVNVKTAATSDEMVTLMNQGGFDLVTASGDASLRLIAGKKLQPINTMAFPISGVRMSLPTTPRSSRKHPRAGLWSLKNRTCPTANPTRAACKPSMVRSMSPMLRSIS
jgi:spermidine/putrescine-binding protein